MSFQTALDKLLRRTNRNAALAGAMLGYMGAVQKLFPIMERYSSLWVHLETGEGLSWERKGATGAQAWRDFLTWYHGRPQSLCFVMRHMDGLTMFRRVDIRRYEIKNIERELPPTGDTRRE